MPKFVQGVLNSLFSSNSLRNHGLLIRSLSTTSSLATKALPPRIRIDEHDIIENFLKGSGPGGQKINKTSSAVQLIHKPSGIVIKCQATRSRVQNRKTARQLLADKLEDREKGDESRTAIKAARWMKKKASGEKKSRRKYRELDEKRKSGAGGKEVVVTEDGEESRGVDTDGDFVKTESMAAELEA